MILTCRKLQCSFYILLLNSLEHIKNCFTEVIVHKAVNLYPVLSTNSKVRNFAVLQQNSGVWYITTCVSTCMQCFKHKKPSLENLYNAIKSMLLLSGHWLQNTEHGKFRMKLVTFTNKFQMLCVLQLAVKVYGATVLICG